MSDNSKIEWTDATWSPTLGCTKVSPGCDGCYAIKTVHRLSFNPNPKIQAPADGLTAYRPGVGVVWTGLVRTLPDRLDLPLSWRKPRMIFVDSQSDLFHERVPDEFIARVFAVMAMAGQHTFQVLTKRHGRMRALLSDPDGEFQGMVGAARYDLGDTDTNVPDPELPSWGWPLPNVWLGVSVENQQWADIRIPALLDTPAAVRWISAEPLLGPVDVSFWFEDDDAECTCTRYVVDYSDPERFHPSNIDREDNPACRMHHPLNWIVAGGESGHRARPMHPEWARSLRDQCVAAGVPFLLKQWGEWGPAPWVLRVCDPAVGWQGTKEELAAAKADAEARGATHVYASWAHEYGHDLYEPPHKPWSLERVEPLDEHQAPMRRWGKKLAGRELDGRIWDQYPESWACRSREDNTAAGTPNQGSAP